MIALLKTQEQVFAAFPGENTSGNLNTLPGKPAVASLLVLVWVSLSAVRPDHLDVLDLDGLRLVAGAEQERDVLQVVAGGGDRLLERERGRGLWACGAIFRQRNTVP